MKNLVYRIFRRIKRMLWHSASPHNTYVSETSKCRPRLAHFCLGSGADLGFGGDPITPSAIRIDMPAPYTKVGPYPVQLAGDAAELTWFRDNSLDYVYSSHLLEDFDDTKSVLREWLRVLKPGGLLLLFCPDEQLFREHCRLSGQTYNQHHKHELFSLNFVKHLLAELDQTTLLHEASPVDIYSWELVLRKSCSPAEASKIPPDS